MKKLLLLTVLTLIAGNLMAVKSPVSTGWNCTNSDLEVSCSAKKCKVATAHTPMDIMVSASKMRICAYSGCWSGSPSMVAQSGVFETYVGTALPFSTSPESLADASVTISKSTKIATVLIDGLFATPATCVQK